MCGDSRQIYAGMRIGSAAPDERERALVPHHGYNVVAPDETYDAGRFLEDTDRYVAEVRARGRLPVIVGGSGLYLRAFRYGLGDVPAKDPEVRARLDAEIREAGPLALYERLRKIDPEAGRTIEPMDPVRIVRALEIWEVTGRRPSELRTTHLGDDVRTEARWLLLDADPKWLAPRIDARARRMFDEGLVEEARELERMVGAGHRLLATMGYEEALRCARGELEREEAIALTAKRQRQYARRQRTWFKKEPWWARLDPSRADLVEQASLQGLGSEI